MTVAANATARAVWFAAPRDAELREEAVPTPSDDEVTIRAVVSLISAGTEMLVYRGESPPDFPLGIETARGTYGRFPVKYGYQVIGEVVEAGRSSGLTPGQLVFAIHPHQELFTMRSTSGLVNAVPAGLDPERAAFTNLLAVALNCMLDVPIRFGDCVVVYGQGVVGSMCAQLARRTAGRLAVVDPVESRRKLALDWGADLALDPQDVNDAIMEMTEGRGADVCIDATGVPAALQSAIENTGQDGTIAAVSFFGAKVVPLVLAPEFHFRRQRIVSSMVASVPPSLQPRWSQQRRTQVAFRILAQDWLRTVVTRQFHFDEASAAYQFLDTEHNQGMGVLLNYSPSANEDRP